MIVYEALEWDAQTNVNTGIVPASMPLMTLASTAIDHVLVDPSDARKTCLSFLPTGMDGSYCPDIVTLSMCHYITVTPLCT